MFDYVFDINSSQDLVYDRIARPIVTDVLKGRVIIETHKTTSVGIFHLFLSGFNGTIFAYGQTGKGKVSICIIMSANCIHVCMYVCKHACMYVCILSL